jgi:hypothetical protein
MTRQLGRPQATRHAIVEGGRSTARWCWRCWMSRWRRAFALSRGAATSPPLWCAGLQGLGGLAARARWPDGVQHAAQRAGRGRDRARRLHCPAPRRARLALDSVRRLRGDRSVCRSARLPRLGAGAGRQAVGADRARRPRIVGARRAAALRSRSGSGTFQARHRSARIAGLDGGAAVPPRHATCGRRPAASPLPEIHGDPGNRSRPSTGAAGQADRRDNGG